MQARPSENTGVIEDETLPSGDDCKQITLISPCSQCQIGGVTTAYFYRHSRPQRIGTQCRACGRKYYLRLDEYGHHFGLTRKKKAKRYKAHETRDVAIFARYSWCCIYHEGSREAREYRIDQFRKVGLLNPNAPLPQAADELQDILEISARKLFSVDTANLFGLVRDHLIPVWTQELLDAHLTAAEKRAAGRDWIVAACAKCNGERNVELESTDKLLFLYSRYVMPLQGNTELERLEDLLLFTSVLKKVEVYRVGTGGGALSPKAPRVAT